MADDIEHTVEMMVCAFILLGIIVVGGWVILTKTGVAFHLGMSEEDLKDYVTEDQYADTLGLMKQQSAGWWLIGIIIAGCGLAGLYIAITEVLRSQPQ